MRWQLCWLLLSGPACKMHLFTMIHGQSGSGGLWKAPRLGDSAPLAATPGSAAASSGSLPAKLPLSTVTSFGSQKVPGQRSCRPRTLMSLPRSRMSHCTGGPALSHMVPKAPPVRFTAAWRCSSRWELQWETRTGAERPNSERSSASVCSSRLRDGRLLPELSSPELALACPALSFGTMGSAGPPPGRFRGAWATAAAYAAARSRARLALVARLLGC
mmetsp:Transcript_1064/g.2887  ORF Transcript_1064/g.2887 Transcript_1064/m.2887 type:complete len:217 (-) Transcript_1064:1002-1652(-)